MSEEKKNVGMIIKIYVTRLKEEKHKEMAVDPHLVEKPLSMVD